MFERVYVPGFPKDSGGMQSMPRSIDLISFSLSICRSRDRCLVMEGTRVPKNTGEKQTHEGLICGYFPGFPELWGKHAHDSRRTCLAEASRQRPKQ